LAWFDWRFFMLSICVHLCPSVLEYFKHRFSQMGKDDTKEDNRQR